MIPKAYITEWSKKAPWVNNYQVEQDLIIERSLVEIFSNSELSAQLAFRGGTALHKMFLNPQVRYSEDIDLVQIKSAPIGEILDHLREALSFLGKANLDTGDMMITLRFKFQAETSDTKLKLKIETNCREHFTELGWQKKNFSVNSDWFTGSCQLTTYKIEELLGTKLRALYQRRKGRDLYDLYKALTHSSIDTKAVVACFKKYIEHSVGEIPSQKEFIKNMERKIKHQEFLADILTLLRSDEKYDQEAAYELVKTELIERI